MRIVGAAVATLALLSVGAAAVVAQTDADKAILAREPAAYFTGTFEESGFWYPVTGRNPETGVLEVRDGWLEFVVEATDARASGVYRIEPVHYDIEAPTGVASLWGTGRVVHDAGAFEGAVRGMRFPTGAEVGMPSGYTVSGWLEGTGAYGGLTYFLRASFDGEQSYVEGIIYEGEAPPLE